MVKKYTSGKTDFAFCLLIRLLQFSKRSLDAAHDRKFRARSDDRTRYLVVISSSVTRSLTIATSGSVPFNAFMVVFKA